MADGQVLTCHVMECVYNKNMECMAEEGIGVGDEKHAVCDTFEMGTPGSEAGKRIADVSMCNVTSCKFNSGRDCTAPGITVDWHEKHADCDTFHPMRAGTGMM